MIERYGTQPMNRIWSEAGKLRVWAYVETMSVQAQGAPEDVVTYLKNCRPPTLADVAAVEQETGHDVIAFLRAWTDSMTPEAKAWVHRGMTSSDLVDSGNAIRLRDAVRHIRGSLLWLTEAMATHAVEHKNTLRIGRTHGQHAEITTWGYRVADFVTQLWRASERLARAEQQVMTIKLSGPLGDYKRIHPATEIEFARLTGTNAPKTATQILSRDGYADLVFACAQLAGVIDSFAMEVRLGQRSEVGELFEGGVRVGSSAMPHKRNPATSENLSGLARVVRGWVAPALENLTMHGEHDLAHSSVERMMLPDVTTLTHHMVLKAHNLVRGLEVDKHRMFATVSQDRTLDSAQAKNWLVEQGISDADAWELVREAAGISESRGEAMVTTVARVVKSSMGPKGRLSAEQYPDLAPEWTEFARYMSLGNEIGNVAHVFERIQAFLAGINAGAIVDPNQVLTVPTLHE